MIKELNLVGILLMVFVKDSIKNNISNLTGIIVKTGFLGTLGNKGNVIVRFDINNVTLQYVAAILHQTCLKMMRGSRS